MLPLRQLCIEWLRMVGMAVNRFGGRQGYAVARLWLSGLQGFRDQALGSAV